MLPTRSNIGALADQSGYITVNQTTRIPLQTTSAQDVEYSSVVTPEVGVGNCRCTETLALMWQPGDTLDAQTVTKWASPDQGFVWQNDVLNAGAPAPLLQVDKSGHTNVTGELKAAALHTPNGNVDTRLAALEGGGGGGGGGGGALPFIYAEFTVTMNSAKTIFQAPGTNVITPTSVIDPQSIWASNVLTIPASGVYKVTFALQMTRGSAGTESPILSVYKSVDTLVKQVINLRPVEVPFSPAGNLVQYDLYMQLTASDTVYMKIEGTGYNGTTHNTGSYIMVQQVA